MTHIPDQTSSDGGQVATEIERLQRALATERAERDRLVAQVASLSERCQQLANRLHQGSSRHQQLRESHDELRLARPLDTAFRRAFERFVDEEAITLRSEKLDSYFKRLAEQADDQVAAAYREKLEASSYAPLLAQLFSEEVLYTRAINVRAGVEYSSFYRGRADIARAEQRGLHLHEVIKRKVDITDDVLGQLIHDDDFEDPPRVICEIGGAWGATIRHLMERFKPKQYLNYEIDRAYAEWAEEHFGARAMPVDGETLTGTDDMSVDLAIANNVLPIIPPIKVWSYLTEMARITRVGGLVVFNALIADRYSRDDLQSLMSNHFPRRAFSLVPKHFVDMALPDTEFELVRLLTNPGSNVGPYCVYRRISPSGSSGVSSKP